MSSLAYIDVCSGISAPTAAWKPLGWQALCYAEIEAAPRSVLAQHYPDVPLVGDFTQIKGTEYGPVDLLVGGTPCQSFSIAGLRGGLADDRGNLALEYLRLADRARPRWLVWENVPGVLSSNGGRDFGAILGGMAELGYGFAYRILDAQHFGVPQRRRRVFVVGYLGDWRRAAAVLFERHGLSGHPAPRREARQIAPTIPSRSTGGGGLGTDFDCDGGLIAAALMAKDGRGVHSDMINFVTHSLRGEGFDASEDGTGRGTPLVPVAFSAKDYGADAMENCSPTLWAGGFRNSHANAGVMPAVAFSIMPMNSGKDYKARQTDVAQPIMAGGPVGGNQGGDYVCQPAVAFMENQRGEIRTSDHANLTVGGGKPGQGYPAALQGSAVRRLTPRECERLQGFPDDFTLVPYRGRMMADGPRYKMLGNSMAVPVMRWIGERIAAVDTMQFTREEAA
ncbi:DNA cytosine methyltransferase [Sphingobium sp. YBL2]|uniref:DNA cytosine methyltransferase n=1 Tax=Sphingobium sp. (strain YBL2) TaxID=484429 RepID=UPI0005CBCB73|nr:DNA (cytosine-5-)-methyltransferase [Sphingobium sp. YBL2]AJR24532.1 hypothetical protein TZ53_13160 [Sphingobium sp. YBL2]